MNIFQKLGLGLLICSQISWAQDPIFYRYKDERGLTVISSQIPAPFVRQGYDIITLDGKLVERIPPEPAPEERDRILKALEEQKQQEALDKELLRRYSHPDDIEGAKQRKLSQIQNDLGFIQRRIDKINDDINRYQAIAANDERIGKEVSQDTLTKIEKLKKERSNERLLAEKKEKEIQEIIQKFDKDMERFRIIKPSLND